MSVSNPAPVPRFLIASIGLLVLAVAFKSFNSLAADYDLWLHLLCGRQIMVSGGVDRVDRFSFTVAGDPVVNHEWLAEAVLAGVFAVGSDTGLILGRWLLVLGIGWMLWRTIALRCHMPLLRWICLLAAVVVLKPGIGFRLHLFTYVLLALVNDLVGRALHHHRPPPLPLITAIFALWANLHGGFVLGLVVWFIYVLGVELKPAPSEPRIALRLLLPAAATLLTPYGLKLWGFVLFELTNPLSPRYISEWQRLGLAPREWGFIGVAGLTWIVWLLSRRPRRLFEWAVLILATVMGFSAVRHTPVFVLLTISILAFHGEGLWIRLQDRVAAQRPTGSPGSRIVAMFCGFGAAAFLWAGYPAQWRIVMDRDPLPVASVAFLKQTHFQGNLWVPLHWGGYVLYHLYPDVRVSIDGRWAIAYSRQVMQENMDFAFHGQSGRWKALLGRYGADAALVEAGNPAWDEMGKDPHWHWVFQEAQAGLLYRGTASDP
jgi:hypothetical protein